MLQRSWHRQQVIWTGSILSKNVFRRAVRYSAHPVGIIHRRLAHAAFCWRDPCHSLRAGVARCLSAAAGALPPGTPYPRHLVLAAATRKSLNGCLARTQVKWHCCEMATRAQTNCQPLAQPTPSLVYAIINRLSLQIAFRAWESRPPFACDL